MTISDHLAHFEFLLTRARRQNLTCLFIYAQHGRLTSSPEIVRENTHIQFSRLSLAQIQNGLNESDWNRVLVKIAHFQRRNWLYTPTGREKPLPACIPAETLPLFDE